VPDRPGILAPPPLIYLAGLALGLLIERYWPTRPLPPAVAIALGIPLALIGLLGIAWATRTMWRGGTTVNPYKSTSFLMTDGPFRYSRNPIYIADAVLYVGLALALDWIWALALLPFVLVVVRFGVIEREERYLERQFSDEYLRYKQRVRRWL
jgi:protein-S-isoprenylcysteine O-methyltransferase Ste14